jgi:negative regulator of flagellin synthesis FlgM
MANEIKLGNAGPALSTHKTAAKSVAADDKPASTTQVAGSDRVSVTDTASRLQKIEEELSAMPEINHEKVAEIKKALADGTFSLDPQRIAEKLIGFETSFKR